MDLGLAGRTVIVTGASGGLGRAIVRGFAAEQADVILTYHRASDQAERIAKELGDRALVLPYTLGDRESARALVAAALAWTGRIDVLVNNAVHWGAEAPQPGRPFEGAPDDEWLRIVRENVEGAIDLTRQVAPVMRERRFGRIVHVSSSIATDGMAGAEYYGAAKAALHGFSRSTAFSLGRDGDLLTNVVMPGLTRTDTNAAIADEHGHLFSAQAPIGRLLSAEEVAGPVVYLGSGANTGVTGQVLSVSGGA